MLNSGFLPILDPSYAPGVNTAHIIEAFLEHEIPYFILRHRALDSKAFASFVDEILALRPAMDFDFIVHNHLAIAQKHGLMGVHLASGSTNIHHARMHLKSEQLVGITANSIEEALDAEESGADYVILQNIFLETEQQSKYPILGIETLEDACRILTIPVFAMGGVKQDNLSQVKDAGAHGFCALRAIYNAEPIEHNIAKLSLLWDEI